MAFGLQMFKASGALAFDGANRPARLAGSVAFSAGSGTIPFTPSSGKTPFAWILSAGAGAPYVSWNGSNAFLWGSSGAASGFIFYGER